MALNNQAREMRKRKREEESRIPAWNRGQIPAAHTTTDYQPDSTNSYDLRIDQTVSSLYHKHHELQLYQTHIRQLNWIFVLILNKKINNLCEVVFADNDFFFFKIKFNFSLKSKLY